MTSILYARHGESTWNAAGRWQGQADPPLSGRGRQQATALAERLLARLGAGGIGLLATSPLAQAQSYYAVEMVIFANPDGDAQFAESWRPEPGMPPQRSEATC